MPSSQLSKPTLELIHAFQNLKFGEHNVRVPYFNNRHAGVRGALRVSIGKGNIEEIKEELKLLSLREKVDLRELDEETITKFIVDHKIGIDCSGLAYYILDAELKARGKKPLKKLLKFPYATNPLRKLLTKLRPAENCSVKTLSHEQNSIDVQLSDIQPGDMIILKNAGPRHDYNHIMIVKESLLEEGLTRSDKGGVITYIHSFQYPSDGQYNHGVREEQITITNPDKSLIEQQFEEEKMKVYIGTAEQVIIKRLKI